MPSSPAVDGGVTIAISGTPATIAGMAFISTEDGYAAFPPGTYNPTRFSGRMIWPSRLPSGCRSIHELRFCFS
ncbi:hypothetical protein D3C85_1733310 [compost metagenome]